MTRARFGKRCNEYINVIDNLVVRFIKTRRIIYLKNSERRTLLVFILHLYGWNILRVACIKISKRVYGGPKYI